MRRRALLAVLALAGAAVGVRPLAAQQRAGDGLAPQWEARAEGRLRDDGGRGALLGGLSLRLDRATRLALLAGGSADLQDDARPAALAEAHVRVLLDPFGTRPVGWYGAAGVGLRAQEERDPSAYVLVLLGVEGPPVLGGRARLAAEVGVGDGVRLAIALRGLRAGLR